MSTLFAGALVLTMASVSGVMVSISLMACRYLREIQDDDQ